MDSDFTKHQQNRQRIGLFCPFFGTCYKLLLAGWHNSRPRVFRVHNTAVTLKRHATTPATHSREAISSLCCRYRARQRAAKGNISPFSLHVCLLCVNFQFTKYLHSRRWLPWLLIVHSVLLTLHKRRGFVSRCFAATE